VIRALLLTLALATMVAAMPAAALAQDAGSNQYQDPLAGEPGSSPNNSNPSGGGGGSGNAPSNGSGTQGVQADGANGTQAAQSRDQLPATGVDAWLLVLAGAMLLAGGLGLRRVAERPTL
jgi:LPXTG-motif cell wall-anchored protein